MKKLLLLAVLMCAANYTYRLRELPIPEPIWQDVTITVYNAVVGQCDSTPFVTASGSLIDVRKLNSGCLRWCAVSRELRQSYHYGDTIEIYIREGHPYNGSWVVHDTMNPRYTDYIDLLVPEDVKLGKWVGQIRLKCRGKC